MDICGVHEDDIVIRIVGLSLARGWVLSHWLSRGSNILLCSKNYFLGEGVVKY
jgi:hypothetical protein